MRSRGQKLRKIQRRPLDVLGAVSYIPRVSEQTGRTRCVSTTTKEQYHGAIQRNLIRMFGALLVTGFEPNRSVRRRQDVVIRGRTRHETKRALLRYWSQHESRLGVELDEFQKRCVWRDDGSVVVR